MTVTYLTKKLPSPKGVALAIMEACQNDSVSNSEVARLLQSDPALTGRLLELANAAALGGRPLVSAHDAVNRMGLQTVQQLALGFSLVDQYGQGHCAGFNYAAFWSHSLYMAVAVRDIGTLLRLGSADEMFSCGLLARVGCLAMATAYPVEFTRILLTPYERAGLIKAEQDLLGTDHLQLSMLLHTQWGIPEPLSQPVLWHEDPRDVDLETGTRGWQLVHVLHLALSLADYMTHPTVGHAQNIAELNLLAGKLGLEEHIFEQCVDAISLGWRHWAERFKIKVAAATPYPGMTKPKVRPDQEPNMSWLRVLLVEDEPVMRELLQTWLRDECQFTVAVSADGKQALNEAIGFNPHVVLTDWMMPVMNGLDLCNALRASEWGRNIYILMLTSNESEDDLVHAFDAGVDDYLVKPVKLRALTARLKAAWRYVRLRDAWERDHESLARAADQLAVANHRLQYAALTDPLTELANRRAGQTALKQAWAASQRHDPQVASILSIDIDHFKRINDLYGHSHGDLVLKKISQLLQHAARREDTVCRWGGEEFLLICPNMALRQGLHAAERLRRTVEATRFDLRGQLISVTVSIGVASWRSDMLSTEQMLDEADRALYNAKQNGRNRVALSQIKNGGKA